MSQAVLAGDRLTKLFGGLKVLDEVSFEVSQGEVFGLIGPNGAGKTTLLNIVSGLIRPTSGRILVNGVDITHKPPQVIRHMGIARTFQVVKPFSGLTVLENVATGAMFGPRPLSVGAALERARRTLEATGLAEKANFNTVRLTIADRKRLELARALAMEPSVILLDEVMAGLNPTEIGNLMELVSGLNSQGITIIVIEHVIRAIMNISHRVMVLNHGSKLAEGKPEAVLHDPRVIEAYLGAGYAQKARGDQP